ncbi:hypothetical protein DPMN_169951 [Dreissena polymorpha]|uniref:Uncharacterized protein n=1 Tax=Dreissena polymorpha TaxID=45954 RepID=A0A9D4DYM3_DREPO|nr:hypothetical protein DPMN_169951 [Dreissena polymorpha]
MLTDGGRTKTNPKTSPEQSAIFQLVREINKTNAKNVTSIVKTAPSPPGGHVFLPIGTICELNSRIKETNVLTKFHENWAKHVTSRVTGGHVFSPNWTIFNLVRDINKTNVLNNFHDDWAKIVTSRVFTRKTTLPTGGHVFQRTGTTFELNQHIIKANILTKFHENWAKNVTSRVLTCFHYIHIEKNAPPTSGHVFSPIWTIFELVRDINKTNVLTNFHDDWAKILTSIPNKENCLPTGGHVFQRTGTI